MTEPAPSTGDATGEPAVDDVTRRVAEVADRPLAEHHEHLSRAHEDLHRALHDQPGDVLDQQAEDTPTTP